MHEFELDMFYQFKEEELERLLVIKQIKSRSINQRSGACKLGITARQLRRIMDRYKHEGSSGVQSRPRGGNRAHSKEFKESVLSTVRQKYIDFGPTFAAEKLYEYHNLKINRETLRQWMIEAEIWKSKVPHKERIHQSRDRRPEFGELVQLDGSHHDWFEGRRAKCCLLVLIDDATSRLVSMRFEESETTNGYFEAIKYHLLNHGRPLAYYSDKHSVFRTTRKDGLYQDTQVHRALRQLNIELICAHSSQAKGRVERANQTLQDRLIKEMRLRNICTIHDANAYIPEFMASYNAKFSVEPARPTDAHRKVQHTSQTLDRVLSKHYKRKLTKNLEFSFNSNLYKTKRPDAGRRYRYAEIDVFESTRGELTVLCKDEILEFEQLHKDIKPPVIVDRKGLDVVFEKCIYPNAQENSCYPQGPQPKKTSFAIQKQLVDCGLVDNTMALS